MKKTGLLFATLAALMLIGAGCDNASINNANKPEQSSAPAPSDTALTGAATSTGNENADKFELNAEPLGNGIVKLNWNTPSTYENNDLYVLLYKNKPNFEYPKDRPYWQRIHGGKTEAAWSNIPPGQTYFKVCLYKNDGCARYSGETMVEVE